MRFSAMRQMTAGGLFLASAFLFFGSSNRTFAKEGQTDDWITQAGLSQPGIPGIISASNTNKPTWFWNASRSAKPSPIHYQVQWCQAGDFIGCETNKMYTDTNSFSFDDSNALVNGIWYMRVRALNEAGERSNYSRTGLGTIQYYLLVSPSNFKADLAGGTARLSWYDCFAGNFRVWGSASGKAGSFNLLGETDESSFEAEIGTVPVYWFYVTAFDEVGNESLPSEVVKVEVLGLKQASGWALGDDLIATFEPIWRDFSLGFGGVAGAKTGVGAQGQYEAKDKPFLDIVPLDYFR